MSSERSGGKGGGRESGGSGESISGTGHKSNATEEGGLADGNASGVGVGVGLYEGGAGGRRREGEFDK